MGQKAWNRLPRGGGGASVVRVVVIGLGLGNRLLYFIYVALLRHLTTFLAYVVPILRLVGCGLRLNRCGHTSTNPAPEPE